MSANESGFFGLEAIWGKIDLGGDGLFQIDYVGCFCILPVYLKGTSLVSPLSV